MNNETIPQTPAASSDAKTPNAEPTREPNPKDARTDAVHRVGELRAELNRLEWRTRPPVPTAARLLGIEHHRRETMEQLCNADGEVKICVGVNPRGQAGHEVRVRFDLAAVLILLAPGISLDTAKDELLKAVEFLETHWAELHEKAEREEHELGQQFAHLVSIPQANDDLPF